jgi:hypothetical protein
MEAKEEGITNVEEALEGDPSPLFSILHINDFSHSVFTILILEDTGKQKLLTRESSPLVNYLRTLRELSMTLFILTHSFGDLAPGVKSNVTQVVLCRGLSNERLGVIQRQTSSGLSYREFIQAYNYATTAGRYLIVDNNNNTLKAA